MARDVEDGGSNEKPMYCVRMPQTHILRRSKVCALDMLRSYVGAESKSKSKDQNLRSLVNSKEDHSFKDIAVDDNTGFLYIWSSGSEVETLQVGHIDVTSGSFVCKSAQNYYAVSRSASIYCNMLTRRREHTETTKLPYTHSTVAKVVQSD